MRKILEISHLFAGLDDEVLAEIETATSVRHVEKGEILFHEGEPAGSFFVVGSGKVKIFKLSAEGKEQVLMVAKPGNTFAEAAIFNDGRFPASAEVIDSGELLAVNRERFVALLGRNPNVAFSLIARLCELLRKMAMLVEGLALTDVTTRVAHYLVRQAERALGNKAAVVNEFTITLPEKKTLLASQLGTIPETFSRSLAKLSKDGVIRVDGANIHITDLGRLRRMVE